MALSRVVSEIFNVEKCRDLEIGVKGHSRSLRVLSFDGLYMVSYLCSLVTLSLNAPFLRYDKSYCGIMDKSLMIWTWTLMIKSVVVGPWHDRHWHCGKITTTDGRELPWVDDRSVYVR